MATATLHERTPSRNKKQRRASAAVLPLLLALAGLAMLLYPVAATVLKNYTQSGQAHVYSEQIISEATQAERDAAIASAHEWNIQNQGMPVLDPWLARITEDNAAYKAYLEELNITEVMGRIIIPTIKSDLPIYHGTTEEVLSRGIGHLYGSSLPVGGEGTHAVLTGHTGLSESTLWDNLKDVTYGDAIYMDVAGQKVKYEVSEIEVVLPEETSKLVPEAGKDQITLITCTPYAVNSHRLLVTAQRVPMDEAEEEVFAKTYNPWQWWMTVALVVAGIVIIAIIALAVRSRKKKREVRENA